MASPCYHGSFFTMKTSEEEGSHFRIPAFFGKFMDRVGRARAPISCLTFILTWSFLQDMCKLNDIHSRWCHQVTFFGGTKNQWWWNVMELHSWSFNRISVLKGNVFWWSFPTWDYFTIYKSPFGDIIWWILNVFCFSNHLFLLHPCIQVFSPISEKNSLVVFQIKKKLL